VALRHRAEETLKDEITLKYVQEYQNKRKAEIEVRSA